MARKHLVNLLQTLATQGINQATSNVVTATGTSREFYEFASADAFVVYVDCTAVAGSGSLAMTLQERDPATGLFAAVPTGEIPAITTVSAAASQRIVVPACYGECYQLGWTLTGTSVTLSVIAQLITWGR